MKPTLSRMFRALCAFAAFGLAASPAVAGTWTYNSSNNRITHSGTAWVLKVSRSGTSLTVTGVYTAPSAASALPLDDAVSGYQITSIGSSAFSSRTGLTGVTIPDGVTSIGDSAFSGCTGLTSVTIPDSVKSIGSYAFGNCTGLKGVVIGNGVTIIFSTAFSGCSGIRDVTLNANLSSFQAASSAFSDSYRSWTNLVIGGTVTSIGWQAFYGCTGLTSVAIGNGVTSIGSYAFYGCSKLAEIVIPDSVVSAIKTGLFSGCHSLTNVVIGNGVTGIEGGAYNSSGRPFYNCTNLTSVVIGSGVINIGSAAFYNTGLTSVTIPGSVANIGDEAFCDCNALTNVVIGSGVERIGNDAFFWCESLASVIIPDSVTSIGDWAFASCDGLTSITIPDSVTDIGVVAFGYCWGLTNVVIGSGVTNIGIRAFDSCTGLTSVVIPDGVTSIGDRAFDYCSGLTNVTIRCDGEALSWGVFRGCYSVRTVTLDMPVISREMCRRLWNENAQPPDEWSLILGDRVTSIGKQAFYECTGLTSVVIGNSVTSIGYWAFEDCTGLTGVVIPDSVTSIGSGAFAHCSALTSVTIPGSVTNIGWEAFSDCTGLTNVVIKSDALIIGSSVFEECPSLTSVFFHGLPPSDGYNIYDGSTTNVTTYILGVHEASWSQYGYYWAGAEPVWRGRPIRIAAAPVYTVTFDAQGGTVMPLNTPVTYGTPFGKLPDPTREGVYFAGWWTQRDGGGSRVRGATVFMTRDDATLYAKWSEVPLPYLSDEGGGNAAATLVTTAYEGFAYDDEGTVRGTVTLSAKAAVKTDRKTGTATTNWTFTAKAVLQAATVSFSGKATGSAAEVALAARTGETLDAALGTEAFYGTLEGGKVGGTLSVAGARNAFADRKDAAAQGRLAAVKGLYNVALISSSLSEPDGRLKGECAGYLALTVGNAGAVKLAGKLADGTAVSGAAKLLEGLNEDGWCAAALYKPLYAKKGFIGGLLWLNPEDGLVRVDADYGWCVDWVCGDVKKGVFERELGVAGGAWTGGGWGQPPYRFGASVPEELPPPAAGLEGGWVSEAFPRELAVTVSGAKWSLPKATAPKKAGTEYDYSGANPSAATLAYTAKTGLFKGTFKLYWDGADAKGKAQHKTAGVSYTGVLVPTEDGGFTGLGAGTATVNKQKVGIPVFLTE